MLALVNTPNGKAHMDGGNPCVHRRYSPVSKGRMVAQLVGNPRNVAPVPLIAGVCPQLSTAPGARAVARVCRISATCTASPPNRVPFRSVGGMVLSQFLVVEPRQVAE